MNFPLVRSPQFLRISYSSYGSAAFFSNCLTLSPKPRVGLFDGDFLHFHAVGYLKGLSKENLINLSFFYSYFNFHFIKGLSHENAIFYLLLTFDFLIDTIIFLSIYLFDIIFLFFSFFLWLTFLIFQTSLPTLLPFLLRLFRTDLLRPVVYPDSSLERCWIGGVLLPPYSIGGASSAYPPPPFPYKIPLWDRFLGFNSAIRYILRAAAARLVEQNFNFFKFD